jgi:hypothetical protein
MPTLILFFVTVTNSHRKGLKKERVPIIIEVGHKQQRKELSDDRQSCPNKYNHKSGRKSEKN